MVDSDVEDEVWVSLSVRGKFVSFSSLGRFQDSNGIKKEVAPCSRGSRGNIFFVFRTECAALCTRDTSYVVFFLLRYK